MIRATGAKLRMLASEAEPGLVLELFGINCGGEVDECGGEGDMAGLHVGEISRYRRALSGWSKVQV